MKILFTLTLFIFAACAARADYASDLKGRTIVCFAGNDKYPLLVKINSDRTQVKEIFIDIESDWHAITEFESDDDTRNTYASEIGSLTFSDQYGDFWTRDGDDEENPYKWFLVCHPF